MRSGLPGGFEGESVDMNSGGPLLEGAHIAGYALPEIGSLAVRSRLSWLTGGRFVITAAPLIRDGEVQLDPQLGGRDRNVVFLEFATRLDLDVWGLR